MKVKFIGENAEQVTGSKILVEYNGKQILLDYGLTQGKGSIKDYKDNVKLDNGLAPTNIEYVISTHAHIDHIGKIPFLYKNGFNGKFICVSKTKEIMRNLFNDSMHITSGIARLLNNYDNTDRHEPIYDREHIDKTLNNLIELDFYDEYNLFDDLYIKFIKAGHTWRSGMIVLEFKNTHKRLVYTGDLGSRDIPYYFAETGDDIPNSNLVIAESTYNYKKDVSDIKYERDNLILKIKQTLLKDKTVLIPSFALQRTPEILYMLYKSLRDWENDYEVWLDSPLASRLFNIYSKEFTELQELRKWDKFNIVKSSHQSEALCMGNNKGRIIVSASGMINEFSRSSFWLKSIVEDKDCLLAKVGYAADNTLLSEMFNMDSKIKIMDEIFSKECDTASYNTFSSHIQRHEMISAYSDTIASDGFYLVHGDTDKYEFIRELNKSSNEKLNSTKYISPTRNDIVEF